MIFLEAFTDGVPTGKDGDPAEQGRKHHKEQTQAIDSDVVTGAERGDPRGALNELVVFCRIEAKNEGQ